VVAEWQENYLVAQDLDLSSQAIFSVHHLITIKGIGWITGTTPASVVP
jgi:hypothetical protein